MEFNKFDRFNKKANETVYAEPEETFHRKLIPQMIMRFMPEFTVNHDDFILDIGCGNGALADAGLSAHHLPVGGQLLDRWRRRHRWRLGRQVGHDKQAHGHAGQHAR